MDIEGLAVDHISSRVGLCPRLKSVIDKNDRTILTDGHIEVFRQAPQSKGTWAGRVPVQVKGRKGKRPKREQPTRSISCSDLRSYQSASGVLYFVVYVDPDTGTCAPYYAVLSPFVIASILSGTPESQSSVSVALRQLPTGNEALEGLLAFVLKTTREDVALGFDPVLAGNLEGLTVYTALPLAWDGPVVLTYESLDYTVVAHTVGGMSIPLQGEFYLYPQNYAPPRTDVRVRAGSIVYVGGTIRSIDSVTQELLLSDGLSLRLRSEKGLQSGTITLRPEPTLAGRLKALEFFTALRDSRRIWFNDTAVQFESPELTNAAQEMERELQGLRDLNHLFQQLNVDPRLVDLDQISNSQLRQLNDVYRGLVLGEELHNPEISAGRALQPFGRWNVLLAILPGSSPGMWRLVDPFAPEFQHRLAMTSGDEDAPPVVVTAYDIVMDEHLHTVLNMRLEEIVPAYEAIAAAQTTHDLANHRVLYLITAADRCPERRDEFLNSADDLNAWLISAQGPDPHHLVNKWQILARRGKLPDTTRDEIRALKRRASGSDEDRSKQLEVACALLLGDSKEIDDLAARLTDEQLKEMQSWPIWNLHIKADGA